MENNENEQHQTETETKPKKVGFFKRLKRGFTSIFQRKRVRKRNNSDPCLPKLSTDSQKRESANELGLSLDHIDTDKPNEPDEKTESGDSTFRPAAKAPIFVNDFTAELKKSLKLRSKMVEEGQTSEAIMQIEMTRSNYSMTEEEIQEAEKKTFEEKRALFESQISGNSLQNSLSRTERLDSNADETKNDAVNDVEGFHEPEMKENVDEISIEINEITNKLQENTEISESKEVETVKETENVTDYELTVSENKEDDKEENIENKENEQDLEKSDDKIDEPTEIITNPEQIELLSNDKINSTEALNIDDIIEVQVNQEEKESSEEISSNDIENKDDCIQEKLNQNSDNNETIKHGILTETEHEMIMNENHNNNHNIELQ